MALPLVAANNTFGDERNFLNQAITVLNQMGADGANLVISFTTTGNNITANSLVIGTTNVATALAGNSLVGIAAFGAANIAIANVNYVNTSMQVAFGTANLAFGDANTANLSVQSAFASLNITTANVNYVNTTMQASFGISNTINTTVQAAFAQANNAKGGCDSGAIIADLQLTSANGVIQDSYVQDLQIRAVSLPMANSMPKGSQFIFLNPGNMPQHITNFGKANVIGYNVPKEGINTYLVANANTSGTWRTIYNDRFANHGWVNLGSPSAPTSIFPQFSSPTSEIPPSWQMLAISDTQFVSLYALSGISGVRCRNIYITDKGIHTNSCNTSQAPGTSNPGSPANFATGCVANGNVVVAYAGVAALGQCLQVEMFIAANGAGFTGTVSNTGINPCGTSGLPSMVPTDICINPTANLGFIGTANNLDFQDYCIPYTLFNGSLNVGTPVKVPFNTVNLSTQESDIAVAMVDNTRGILFFGSNAFSSTTGNIAMVQVNVSNGAPPTLSISSVLNTINANPSFEPGAGTGIVSLIGCQPTFGNNVVVAYSYVDSAANGFSRTVMARQVDLGVTNLTSNGMASEVVISQGTIVNQSTTSASPCYMMKGAGNNTFWIIGGQPIGQMLSGIPFAIVNGTIVSKGISIRLCETLLSEDLLVVQSNIIRYKQTCSANGYSLFTLPYGYLTQVPAAAYIQGKLDYIGTPDLSVI